MNKTNILKNGIPIMYKIPLDKNKKPSAKFSVTLTKSCFNLKNYILLYVSNNLQLPHKELSYVYIYSIISS
jgi:hypothetical protein